MPHCAAPVVVKYTIISSFHLARILDNSIYISHANNPWPVAATCRYRLQIAKVIEYNYLLPMSQVSGYILGW